MIKKEDYIRYLISTHTNYTATHLAEHSAKLSHDAVSDFLRREHFSPSQLWEVVSSHIDDHAKSAIIVDDSVQDKRYSRFIELVKCQYSGNEHGTVRGIGLVNFVHSGGNDGDFWPIDYRIYHPDTDGKTKNDHFQEMFARLITHKHFKARTILFDTWYGSVDNLKLIHRSSWTFFTTLKSNRKVSVSRDIGYQHLDELIFNEQALVQGLVVKLQKLPFQVKLFKIVATDGRIEWIVTNDLDQNVNCFVAELKNENRWQVEDFHSHARPGGFKQLTGSEKCQSRKARAQRNHLACCYHAWISLKVKAKQLGTTIYQIKHGQLTDYLVNQLYNTTIQVI
ncbi:hypothetical protein OKW21_004430 [Catalinimonas alkaloidigena]|uniref:IS701 family transposase n=1 Tax=Catalinimonas alkaloidigena TaxID=1075417 RepID=UPI0024068389|nr:transposase [Catalinimonas alkaloidigena]MDF9799167.1 hypothetical protein [Catalinimonas alkaloidigena]